MTAKEITKLFRRINQEIALWSFVFVLIVAKLLIRLWRYTDESVRTMWAVRSLYYSAESEAMHGQIRT